jgi:hypothetical protein
MRHSGTEKHASKVGAVATGGAGRGLGQAGFDMGISLGKGGKRGLKPPIVPIRAGGCNGEAKARQGNRKNRWTAHTVIPAKAGTQANGLVLAWAPASAGVTKGANWTARSSCNRRSMLLAIALPGRPLALALRRSIGIPLGHGQRRAALAQIGAGMAVGDQSSDNTILKNGEIGALTGEHDIPVLPVQDLSRPCVLQQVRGPQAPEIFELVQETLVVGRADDADIRVPSTSLSRRHMRLDREGAGYRAIDLDSANGVYLNEVRVHSAVLRDGDTLQLGSAVFVFYEGR